MGKRCVGKEGSGCTGKLKLRTECTEYSVAKCVASYNLPLRRDEQGNAANEAKIPNEDTLDRNSAEAHHGK